MANDSAEIATKLYSALYSIMCLVFGILLIFLHRYTIRKRTRLVALSALIILVVAFKASLLGYSKIYLPKDKVIDVNQINQAFSRALLKSQSILLWKIITAIDMSLLNFILISEIIRTALKN